MAGTQKIYLVLKDETGEEYDCYAVEYRQGICHCYVSEGCFPTLSHVPQRYTYGRLGATRYSVMDVADQQVRVMKHMCETRDQDWAICWLYDIVSDHYERLFPEGEPRRKIEILMDIEGIGCIELLGTFHYIAANGAITDFFDALTTE